MTDYLKSSNIIEEKIYIEDIPAILFRPKGVDGPVKTIMFYHGWTSSKEGQRLRALIYATVGYQVLIPDAIYHGERGPIDYNTADGTYFWRTILNNLDESDILIEELIGRYNADPENISVIGHSMGGFTAAGIFTHNTGIKSAVVFNGACAWGYANEILKAQIGIEITDELKELENRINKIDPLNNLELLKDRPIFMAHGNKDGVVSIESQRYFLRKAKPVYSNQSLVKLIEYHNVNHHITTGMMEDSIAWLYKG